MVSIDLFWRRLFISAYLRFYFILYKTLTLFKGATLSSERRFEGIIFGWEAKV
jgi:hypothetical protein